MYSCRTCFGFHGPLPPLDAPQPEGETIYYCSIPHTPDENGVLAPCGGHGDWQGTECVCHFNNIQGYWARIELTQTFTRVLGGG